MEPFKANYTELKIRPNVTEAIAVADVVFPSKAGTIDVIGLPAGVNKDNIDTYAEGVYTDVESVLDPTNLDQLLARDPECIIFLDDEHKTPFEGKLVSRYHRNSGPSLIDNKYGYLNLFPGVRGIERITISEPVRSELLLKVSYAKESASDEKGRLNVGHLLSGLSFSGIVYELGFGEKLFINPFVYVSNGSALDFKDVKLSLVMP